MWCIDLCNGKYNWTGFFFFFTFTSEFFVTRGDLIGNTTVERLKNDVCKSESEGLGFCALVFTM